LELIDLIQQVLATVKDSQIAKPCMDHEVFLEHIDTRKYDNLVRDLNKKAHNSIEANLKKLLRRYQDMLHLRLCEAET
jgi:hypothetical protein